jgi:ubiquinone biosynthesis protein
MERVRGIPVSDVAALKRSGIDLRTLAHHGVEIFFTQAFRDGYFHADMHPGNIFVAPDGKYCAVDFGIMGTLSERDKLYIAENLLGFFNRDYRAVAEAHVRAGWVNRATRLDEFESAIRAVCEPIFARPISEISFGRLLLRLFQTARQFDMEVQPQLVLLQKTLFNIEGLGRQLYPELNLWDTAKPYLEQWMRDEFGPRALWRGIESQWPRWSRLIPEMPALFADVLRKAGQGELSMGWRSGSLERLRVEMRANHQRLLRAVIGGSLLIAAAIVLATDPSFPLLGQGITLAVAGAGALFLVSAWPWRRP